MHAPIAPKRDGWNVLTVDHALQDELRKKYASDPKVKTENIERVDAIDDGRDFSEILSIPERSLSYMLSSHNIEHLPDPISFFLRCEKALAPGGRLFLLVPDRRGTFDYLRPHSTTGQVLEAHHLRRKRHSPGALFDHGAYPTAGNGPSASLLLRNTPAQGYSKFLAGIEGGDCIDAHAWIFTVSSFLLLIHELRELGLIRLGVEAYYSVFAIS